MPKIIFIVGPTAAGKTKVSFLLASRIKAEVISADSMLIYRQPKIITSKPPDYMLEQVKHHFVGIIPVEESYSVFDYYTAACGKIRDLVSKNIPVVVCGGSGLYVKVILDGIFEGPGKDETLRGKLAEQAKIYGKDYLHRKLEKADPESARKISPNDLTRIIRALEVYYLSGETLSEKKKETFGLWGRLPVEMFGLRFSRSLLYERINQRADTMFDSGVVDEVRDLLSMNLSFTARKIIGIREIEESLSGAVSEEDARQAVKKNTRNFAKRQLTWFRKDKRIQWIDADELSADAVAKRIFGMIQDN